MYEKSRGTPSPEPRGFPMLTPRRAAPRMDAIPRSGASSVLKPVLQLAAVGVLGVALWKVLSVFMLPLLGTLLGLLLKAALLAGLAFLVVWWLRKPKDSEPKDGEAPAS